jgi:hypothetical protein
LEFGRDIRPKKNIFFSTRKKYFVNKKGLANILIIFKKDMHHQIVFTVILDQVYFYTPGPYNGWGI